MDAAIPSSSSKRIAGTLNALSALVALFIVAAAVNAKNVGEMKAVAPPVEIGQLSTVPMDNRIEIAEWKQIEGDPSIVVVDSRRRIEYARGHLLNAVNIPAAELESRAIYELSKSKTVVVYCGYNPKCERAFAARGAITPCSDVARVLKNQLQFPVVKVLAVPEADLLASGTIFASYDLALRQDLVN